ncbi:MAG: DUF4876 domain-containing protein [Muribaculum sp.]|nr:DUF4876 domain-containing protein [Muribaculaceae bacterium]MCM1080703.1 DUF4876 domain-containing protein [Muribaculum sp.]
MKRFLYLLPLVAMLFGLASCSDSKDDVIKHKATVVVSLPSEVTVSDVTSLSVTATNTTTGEAVSTMLVLPSLSTTFDLTSGTYNFTATGKSADYSINGVASGVEVFADKSVNINLIAVVGSSIVFKEVYFAGVPDFYFQDQFYELYNNTDEVQYLDGIILGAVDLGLAPSTWSKDQPSVWMTNGKYTDGKYPLTSHVQCFPGNGTDYPLQPRTSVIIAANPINHSARTLGEADEKSPVDLSNAQWQLYTDNAFPADTKVDGVPAMQFLWKTFGREMMPATEGQPLILARLKDGKNPVDYVAEESSISTIPGGSSTCLMIPADCILDAIDIVPASNDCHYKRIEAKDDAGMAWYTGADGVSNGDYSGRSLRRKVAGFTLEGKAILKDTNNSSNDFIIGGSTPTPGVMPTVAD